MMDIHEAFKQLTSKVPTGEVTVWHCIRRHDNGEISENRNLDVRGQTFWAMNKGFEHSLLQLSPDAVVEMRANLTASLKGAKKMAENLEAELALLPPPYVEKLAPPAPVTESEVVS